MTAARKPKPKPLTRQQRKVRVAILEIAQVLPALERVASDAGLFLTRRALNRATQVLGWEAAGDFKQAMKVGRS